MALNAEAPGEYRDGTGELLLLCMQSLRSMVVDKGDDRNSHSQHKINCSAKRIDKKLIQWLPCYKN